MTPDEIDWPGLDDADLDAVRADDALIEALRSGDAARAVELIDPDDAFLGALLAAWRHDARDRGTPP